MFKKEKEQIKETSKEVKLIIVGLSVAATLTIGYVLGSITTTIMFRNTN